MFRILLILLCLGMGITQAQTNNRRAQNSAVPPSTSLPSDPMMQTFLTRFESALKVPVGAVSDPLSALFFNKAEYAYIHEQTYQHTPGPKDLATFDNIVSVAQGELAHFRDSSATVQLLQLQERRGDGNLRAMVSTVKLSLNQETKIVRLILLKYNQEYRIMMIDQ